MLEILDQEYFDSVCKFADEKGLREQLEEQLLYLKDSIYSGKAVCKLGKDFAPFSFAFVIYLQGQFIFNGGLIYQGPDSPANGGLPSFTVSLHNKTGWFIHT